MGATYKVGWSMEVQRGKSRERRTSSSSRASSSPLDSTLVEDAIRDLMEWSGTQIMRKLDQEMQNSERLLVYRYNSKDINESDWGIVRKWKKMKNKLVWFSWKKEFWSKPCCFSDELWKFGLIIKLLLDPFLILL